MPSLLLLLAGKEAGDGEENAGVSGIGGKDWKLASFGGGAKAAASSSLSLAVSTHWPFFGSHTICHGGRKSQETKDRQHSTATSIQYRRVLIVGQFHLGLWFKLAEESAQPAASASGLLSPSGCRCFTAISVTAAARLLAARLVVGVLRLG